jgi:hypothetical protein
MKKTLIALAALAAFGTASAQVVLTGSASVATQKNLAGTSTGLAMTDNTLNVTATEDLGGGMTLRAAFTLENDTNRGAAFTRANQTFAIVTPVAIIGLANTRSGSAQSASLIAPSNLVDNVFTSQVITRTPIDVASVTFPLGSFGLSLSYVEAQNVAAAAMSGAAAPGSISYALGGTYAQGPLSLAANFTTTTWTDTISAALLAANTARNTSTDFRLMYDAGIVAIGLGYDSPRRGAAVADGAATLLGVKATFGQVSMGVNYGKRDAATVMHVAVQYDLSKRTNLNGSFGNDNQGTVGAPTNDQFRLSLNHSF